MIKKLIIIIVLVIIIIVGLFIFEKYKYSQRDDIKIPVLVYHNFVTTVPDNDPDNFNYINTPQSFEENIKAFLENGYTIMSMSELNDANNGKIELPAKPLLITFDDVAESYRMLEENLGKKNFKAFAYPYGAYTNETVLALKINGIDFQIYNLGINHFNSFNKDFIKKN